MYKAEIKVFRCLLQELPAGSSNPFAQKLLASCPNFYKTVEKKLGPYDATKAVLADESGWIQFFRVNTCQV